MTTFFLNKILYVCNKKKLMRIVKFYIITAVFLCFSFQCHKDKPSVNNSFIEISGKLVNENSEPLVNFELFYGVALNFENIISYNSEKVFNTDADGAFSVFVIEPSFNSLNKHHFNIVFKDTNYYFINIQINGDEQENNFIDIRAFSILNKKMDVGTLTILQ